LVETQKKESGKWMGKEIESRKDIIPGLLQKTAMKTRLGTERSTGKKRGEVGHMFFSSEWEKKEADNETT